jgi:hypothetical protein
VRHAEQSEIFATLRESVRHSEKTVENLLTARTCIAKRVVEGQAEVEDDHSAS